MAEYCTDTLAMPERESIRPSEMRIAFLTHFHCPNNLGLFRPCRLTTSSPSPFFCRDRHQKRLRILVESADTLTQSAVAFVPSGCVTSKFLKSLSN